MHVLYQHNNACYGVHRLKSGFGQRATGKLYPKSNWAPHSNQGKIKQQKEKDELCLSYAVPKNNGSLTSTAPAASGRKETKN